MDAEDRYHWIAARILPYEGEVRRWLRQHVPTLGQSDADDVLQEAYARIWNSDFARIGNARGYFYRVVRNLLSEQARRARIVPMERMTEILALAAASEAPGPERQVTARQELRNLCRIVAALPSQCRRVFRMRAFDDCSRREIATRLGLSERTVEKHLSKAYLRIGEALSHEGGLTPVREAAVEDEDEHDVSG